MQILPVDAKVRWEIEEYICKNHNHYAGVSVAKVTMGHKFTAFSVKKEYGIDVDEFDVLATMRYMVNVGNLVSAGMFGSVQTYVVNREVAQWEDENR